VVWRVFDKLLGQHHLVDGAILDDSLDKQVAGELHMAKHAHLRIGGLARVPSLAKTAELSGVSACATSRHRRRAVAVRPNRGGWPADARERLSRERGARCSCGQAFRELAGRRWGDKGTLAGQKDIELIDQLGHGDVAEDSHADNGPGQMLHGHTATT